MATDTVAIPPKPRTIVYIDGLNLYYGAVRDAPCLEVVGHRQAVPTLAEFLTGIRSRKRLVQAPEVPEPSWLGHVKRQ